MSEGWRRGRTKPDKEPTRERHTVIHMSTEKQTPIETFGARATSGEEEK